MPEPAATLLKCACEDSTLGEGHPDGWRAPVDAIMWKSLRVMGQLMESRTMTTRDSESSYEE